MTDHRFDTIGNPVDYQAEVVSAEAFSCAKESLRAFFFRICEERGRWTGLDDMSVFDEDYLVRYSSGKAHLVRDHQHGHALFG